MSTTTLSSSSVAGMAPRRWGMLVVGLGLGFLPGIAGVWFESGAWYDGLAKSALTPPGWVFPIAWTALYCLIGVTLYLAMRAGAAYPHARRRAAAVFAVQLVLNAAWSAIFFGAHAPRAALVEIIALWLAIASLVTAFHHLRPLAAYLLVPYLAWVTFAAFLNLEIVRVN